MEEDKQQKEEKKTGLSHCNGGSTKKNLCFIKIFYMVAQQF
jgi:hypothetical protein